MTKRRLDEEFWEYDYATQAMQAAARRHRQVELEQEPGVLRPGFHEEDGQADPARIGLDSPTDHLTVAVLAAPSAEVEMIIAHAMEVAGKVNPQFYHPDRKSRVGRLA